MLWGVVALGLKTGGSVGLVLVETVVFGRCSAGLDWVGAVVLDFSRGVLNGARLSWTRSTNRRLSDYTP